MAEDLTPKETLVDEATSEETAEVKETPTEEKTPEPQEDYKSRWEQQRIENIRLAKKLKETEAKTPPVETVETETGGETLDQIVDKKVQERLAPLTKEQEEAKVDKWLGKNPKAIDYLKEIEEMYSSVPGKNTEQKLENAFLIASKEAAKNAGKKEMAFALYQKEQAIASGGVSSQASSESLPILSEEQKKVAQAMGIKEEVYAKRLLEKTTK